MPDTATLRITPTGVGGFRSMRLKAGPSRSMLLQNWRQLASKANVEINGVELNDETNRQPRLTASSSITARTPAMTYELTPRE